MWFLILARVEKTEVIPDNKAPKKPSPTICRQLLLNLLFKLVIQTVEAGKISQQTGFVTRFLNSIQTGKKLSEKFN